MLDTSGGPTSSFIACSFCYGLCFDMEPMGCVLHVLLPLAQVSQSSRKG